MLKEDSKKENVKPKKPPSLFYEKRLKNISFRYEFINSSEQQIDKAFDILFEETVKTGNS